MDLMKIVPFRTILVCSLFAFAVVGCQEQGGERASSLPTLEIVGGDTIDWKNVGGGKLEKKLQLVNVGGGILNIAEIKPSCGCTTTAIDKEELRSGDTATIGVVMDVTGRQGDYIKSITITTNDSTAPVRNVTLKAHVIQEIVADPNYFAISDIKPGEKGSATVSIKNVSDKPITVQKPEEVGSTLMNVKFDMSEPKTLQPGDSFPVTATAVTLNPASDRAQYVFATDSEMTPELKINVNVRPATSPSAPVSSSGPVGIGN